MWESVPEGSCVERWLNVLDGLGSKIEWVREPDWYRVWCPAGREFHHFQVSTEMADNCRELEKRLRHMTSLKGLI